MKYSYCSVAFFAIIGMLVPLVHSLMFDECVKKTGANEADQAPVIGHVPPTTRNGFCLMACLMKKEGLMTPENKINMNMLYKDIESEKEYLPDIYNIKMQIYKNCSVADIKNSDECIVAKEYAECVYVKENAFGVQKFVPYERKK